MEKQTNRYALVTGGTSGIGYELARQAALNGYNLIIVSRDIEQLEKVSKEFGKSGVEVKTILKDLFKENAAEEIYAEVKGTGVIVDILINDAGQGYYGKFAEAHLEKNIDIIRLNVIGLVSLTHFFLKDMLARNEGKILQLGSEVSKLPMPLMATYAASKAFVLSFSEALINELKDTNVTMTVLMPGATDTDFFDKAGMEHTKVYKESKFDSPIKVAQLGFEALMNGERRVIGPAAKLNLAMASVTPDDKLADQLRKQMEPSLKTNGVRTKPGHQPSLENKQKLKPR